MCTKIDDKATKAKRNRLKNKNNIGWKIVIANGSGGYRSPFVSDFIYNLTGVNVEFSAPWSRSNGVYGGVFHFFTTRSIGRRVLKVLKSVGHYMSQFHLKLVKVFYNKEDFYGIGNSVNFSGEVINAIKNHQNNTICVKAFTFAEK